MGDANYVHVVPGSEMCLNGHPIVQKVYDGSPWLCADEECEYSVKNVEPKAPMTDIQSDELKTKIGLILSKIEIENKRELYALEDAQAELYALFYQDRQNLFQQVREAMPTKIEEPKLNTQTISYMKAIELHNATIKQIHDMLNKIEGKS